VQQGGFEVRAPFCIIEQKTGAGRVYVARFFNAEGRVVRSKTFPKARSRTAAARLADTLLREGVIAKASNPNALEYLQDFWTAKSDYVRGRALRGIVLSKQYLDISRSILNKHVSPYIKGKKLLDLNADFIEDLILDLSTKGIKPRTVNAAIACIRVPMRYFCKRNRVLNPMGSVEMLTENPRERGILSIAELQKVIALEGESPRAKAGALLGALCGLRLGEARAVMPQDIDCETMMLTVCHNAIGNELKGPKGSRADNMRIRQVPVPKPVMDALEICSSIAPAKAKYYLWNEHDPVKPVDGKTLQNGLKRILKKIGIDEAERKRRNIVFHSLRHNFVSLSRASGTPDFITAQESGHKSSAMLDTYSRGAANVIDFQALRINLEKTIAPNTYNEIPAQLNHDAEKSS